MNKKIHVISMPKWGMEMSEGTVLQWHIAEGEEIISDMDLVDIETSKIVNTISAHSAGVLSRILAKEGDTLPVGAPLAIQSDQEVSGDEVDLFIRSLSGEKAGEGYSDAGDKNYIPDEAVDLRVSMKDPEVGPESKSEQGSGASSVSRSDVHASAVARRLAENNGVDLSSILGTGRRGRISKADVEKVIDLGVSKAGLDGAGNARYSTHNPGEAKVTPVARRLAQSLGIDVNACKTSGKYGRVGKSDVEDAFLAKRDEAVVGAQLAGAAVTIPLSATRKIIAERLTYSKKNAPHFRVNAEVNIEKLLRTTKKINEKITDERITINDFFIKACAESLKKVPEINVQFDGNSIYGFENIDISVAVALDTGLVTPIIRQVEKKGLIAISRAVNELVVKAKQGLLKAGEYQGGTFTISNLGMFGVKSFDAIINPPQCAILAIGAAEKRAVVKKDEMVIQTLLNLSLSCDHRVIDGAIAARFMSELKTFIENPSLMLA